jgi:riboflavin kinase / FMN adenylyltransferase
VQVVNTLDRRISDQPVVLTIGKFDGMHLGHQLLIGTAVQRARELGIGSAVLTWDPSPDAVVHPERPVAMLTSPNERRTLVEGLGATYLLLLPFTRETMGTPADVYMRQIHAALPLRELWVGEDFSMGRKREGNIPRLIEIGHELGYTVGTVAPKLVDGVRVSSSRVRDLLSEGRIAEIVPLLGRQFAVEGPVVHGDARGRTIGFPTANIAVPGNHALPADGVYACYAHLGDEKRPAVANIGVRPTFEGLQRRVEAHLLDFDRDLYGQMMRLSFVERLRGEQKFSGIEELVAQIGRDVARGRAVLGAAN